jgi:hypothetical protein
MKALGLKRVIIVAVASAGLAVPVGMALVQVSAETGAKPQPPFSRGSDDEYARLIATARLRNEVFLSAFKAQGRDPHSLRRVTVATTYDPGPGALRQAVGAADLVVKGRVLSVEFRAKAFGGVGEAISTIDVSETLKGVPGSRVTVVQPGGPMASQDGAGILAQTDTDELVLPGDEVILLLRKPVQSHATTVPAAGVYFIRGGFVQPEASNRFGATLRGERAVDFVAALRGLV